MSTQSNPYLVIVALAVMVVALILGVSANRRK